MNSQFQFKGGNPPASQAGYTILEGLMAVVVVAVLVSAIGPVVAFSVGTRVQAKRVELATQAARSYIDAVKADPVNQSPKLNSITAPATGDLTSNCTSKDGYCTADNQLYCVNFDDTAGCQINSLVDMVIQPIITDVTDNDVTNSSQGYEMQVAVYRANSFSPGITLKAPTKSDSLITNALGDRSLPLVVFKTEVLPSEATYIDLQERLDQ